MYWPLTLVTVATWMFSGDNGLTASSFMVSLKMCSHSSWQVNRVEKNSKSYFTAVDVVCSVIFIHYEITTQSLCDKGETAPAVYTASLCRNMVSSQAFYLSVIQICSFISYVFGFAVYCLKYIFCLYKAASDQLWVWSILKSHCTKPGDLQCACTKLCTLAGNCTY